MREGIVYKQLNFALPIEDDTAIVRAYEQAITPRTKIIHVTHMINWVGQIMPVEKIADMAHAHSIEVICDSAHSFGLMDFKIPDLHCDYFGTSLHKFLSAPIGSGMLWIKPRQNRKNLAAHLQQRTAQHKHPQIRNARNSQLPHRAGHRRSHQLPQRHRPQTQGRPHPLPQGLLASRVQSIPRVKLHTSLNAQYSCAICGVSIDGMTPSELENALFNQYKIHTVGIVWENISCVRVTPHVYTSIADLDKLVRAIGEIAAKQK